MASQSVAAPTPGAAAPAGTPPGVPVARLTALVLVVIGLVGTGETSRLVSGSLTPDRQSRSVGALSGPLAWSHRDDWAVWESLGELRTPVAEWIVVHSIADAACYGGFVWLLWRLVGTSPVPRRLLRWLLGVQLVESLLFLLAASALAGGEVGSGLPTALAAVTTVTWVLAALLLVAALRDQRIRARLADLGRRTAFGLQVQRLSTVVVVLLAALSLVPLPGIWDQFPDVLRGWFDGHPRAHLHWGIGVGAYWLVAVGLFALGRQRAERAWSTEVGGPGGPSAPHQPAEYWWWWRGPVAAAVFVAVLYWRGYGRLVHWPALLIVVSVPLAVLLASFLVGCAYGPRLWRESRRQRSEAGRRRALAVWVVGDVLALAVPLVGALAVVRALLAPVLLGLEVDAAAGSLRAGVLGGCLVLSLALPWLADRGARWLDTRPTGHGRLAGLVRFLLPTAIGGRPGLLGRTVPLATWYASMGLLLALMFWPVGLSAVLGVVGTALLALFGWGVLVGFLIVHLQYRQPAAVFRWMKLQANPVLSLFLLAAFLASLGGGGEDLHQLRRAPGAAATPERPSLEAAFASWLDRNEGCTRTVAGRPVQPLVLVGASGGGIRAAAWTAGVLGELQSAGPCASSSVFLSSGVSGGSVGLAVARGFADLPPEDLRARSDLDRLAAPDALSAAIAGTLVGDVVAGSTGLRLPSRVDGTWEWRDRAGLMEEVWEREVPRLADRYGPGARGPVGELVLNSTAIGRGCRVLVSQVRFDGGPPDPDAGAPEWTAAPREVDCATPGDQPAASLDLQETYGRCMPRMSWATAAMLSARFPTVTPGGRVPPTVPGCGRAEQLQLADGGYAEGSGLGTLADVSADVVQVVRDHNAGVGDGGAVVVPLVLYLEDEPRTDLVQDPPQLVPELLLPLVGLGEGAAQTSTQSWLQRLAAAIAEPCPSSAASSACARAVQAVHAADLADAVVVAAPLTRPAVEAPLGWTLSSDSEARLGRDLDRQTGACADDEAGQYPCLADLLGLLEAPPDGGR